MLTVRSRRGFTLVELAVVLALVALALGFGLSTLSDVISNNRVRSTAQQVSDAVQLARSEAVKRAAPVLLGVANTALTLNYDGAATCPAPAVSRCQVITFSSASGLAVTPDGGTPLLFNSYGQMSVAVRQIDITNTRCAAEQSCLRVLVSGGGRVRICNPSQGDVNATNFCA